MRATHNHFSKSCMLATLGAAMLCPNALAEEGDGWSVTVTPRVQATLFVPHQGESYETMTSYGGTAMFAAPDSRFAIVGEYFTGEASTRYQRTNVYDYEATRQDGSLRLEYTPEQSTVTFIGGIRSIKMDFEENAVAPVDVHSEYDVSILGGELGVRIVGRINPESRHLLSAQITGYVGQGEYNEITTGADVTNINTSETALATGVEFAGGYTMFASNSLAIGARVRGFVYQLYIDDIPRFGEFVGYGWGPELNASIRF